jgi:hypothetical protein
MTLRMRLTTAVEYAATAATRWRSQYRDWTDTNRFSDGTTKGQVDEALDQHRHTPENIAGIINPGWAYPQCNGCGERYEAVAEISEDWGDRSFTICFDCSRRAYDMLLGYSGDHRAIENANRTGSAMLSPEPQQ